MSPIRKNRCLRFNPKVKFFKPQGVPLRQLEEVCLSEGELEALKLYEIDGLEQKEAANRMHISQPTFSRDLSSAYKKLAEALVFGKAIKVEAHD